MVVAELPINDPPEVSKISLNVWFDEPPTLNPPEGVILNIWLVGTDSKTGVKFEVYLATPFVTLSSSRFPLKYWLE